MDSCNTFRPDDETYSLHLIRSVNLSSLLCIRALRIFLAGYLTLMLRDKELFPPACGSWGGKAQVLPSENST
jgi:hypothetical protein